MRGASKLRVGITDMYEAIAETFEILEDEELMGQLRGSIREAKEGRTRPLAELRADLDA